MMSTRVSLLLMVLPCLALGQGAIKKPEDEGPRWPVAKTWQWYEKAGSIRGCNYLPRTAVNSTAMWQADTFDPKTIDQELGWAEDLGYNGVRVFVQFIVWQQDAKALRKRFEQFLKLANRHRIRVMPVLFDDCAFAGREPYLGRQDDPVPGVHNSGWVPSPGLARVTNSATWPELENYVKDMVGSFRRDSRVLLWDLYNEPGNSGMGEKSLPLLEAAFKWARDAHPSQPLTAAPFDNFHSVMSKRMMALSDVTSFHAYDDVPGLKSKLELCRALGRPMICSECLHRASGNTFTNFVPLFALYDTSWFNWGLVAGRTQTYMPWGSKKGDPMPAVWQHDVLRSDGQPFDPKETELLRTLRRSASN